MPDNWIKDLLNKFQVIFYGLAIITTIIGLIYPYATDFWKGFALGAIIVFLLWLVYDTYQKRTEPKIKKKETLEEVEEIAENIESLYSEGKVLKKYHYQSYDIDLKKGEFLNGEVEADSAVNIYLFKKKDYEKWQEDDPCSSIIEEEEMTRVQIEHEAVRNEKLVLVVENKINKSVKFDVDVFKETP